MTVYKKILAVKKAIKTVPKNGTLEVNGRKQYDFARDADVLAMLNEITNVEGLIIIASQESSEIGYFEVTNQYGSRTQRSAKVRMKFEIIDVDDPADSVISYFDGYAEDTSDKPLTKATTSACKYFMLKFFGIPTGDDLEADPTVHEPTTVQKKSAPKQVKNQQVTDLAGLIVEACKLACLTPEQVREITGLPSIKETAERGDVPALAQAWNKVQAYLQKKGAA